MVERYDAHTALVKDIPAARRPSAFGGFLHHHVWYAPGGASHIAQLVEDAGGVTMLVLEGVFQATFPSEEVSFDIWSGHFKPQAPALGRVDLVGDGLVTLRTEPTLEREGLAVNDRACATGRRSPEQTLALLHALLHRRS